MDVESAGALHASGIDAVGATSAAGPEVVNGGGGALIFE